MFQIIINCNFQERERYEDQKWRSIWDQLVENIKKEAGQFGDLRNEIDVKKLEKRDMTTASLRKII